ncbi:MAG: NAD-dependent epimerase/dehydratase family protein [bacterium]
MQKVVVSGGAGFIGSHVAQHYGNKGYKVVVIDNLRSGKIANLEVINNLQFINQSITNKDEVFKAVEGADYIFNFAALVSVPESIEKPYECVNINVNGILNLLEAAKTHKVKKVVHISSAAVYGDDPELPKRVTMKPAPKTPYSITKLDGEYYCNMYSEQFGLKTTTLRFFNVFGERQDPKSQYAAAVPIFIEKALKNEDITIFGDGLQTRDFIYVKDIVQACSLAAESPLPTGLFNVAYGRTITILEIAELIIKLTGSQSKINFAPQRSGDIKHSYAYVQETFDILKFNPNWDLIKGLEATINYFK